jgi:hypothetical protein
MGGAGGHEVAGGVESGGTGGTDAALAVADLARGDFFAAFLRVVFLAVVSLAVVFFARLATFLVRLAAFLRVVFLARRVDLRAFLVAFLRRTDFRAAFLAVFRTARLAILRPAARFRAFATNPPGESTLAPWMRGFGRAYVRTPA